MTAIVVRPLSVVQAEAARPMLAAILTDCVAGGASIGFMWPFTEADAAAWWGGVIARVASDEVALFGASLDGALVGSAQIGFAFAPNQRHRAEVKKVIVRTSARGRGVAPALMGALEVEARGRGKTLLTLDTVTGSTAERLYERLGWRRFGILPGQALWPDGRFCDVTHFWKTP